jgi:hypothetical protein
LSHVAHHSATREVKYRGHVYLASLAAA